MCAHWKSDKIKCTQSSQHSCKDRLILESAVDVPSPQEPRCEVILMLQLHSLLQLLGSSHEAHWTKQHFPHTQSLEKAQPARPADVLDAHALNLLSWTRDLVRRLYGPKDAEVRGTLRRLFWCTHSVSYVKWNGWGAIFERDIQFSLMHPCDVHGSQCTKEMVELLTYCVISC